MHQQGEAALRAELRKWKTRALEAEAERYLPVEVKTKHPGKSKDPEPKARLDLVCSTFETSPGATVWVLEDKDKVIFRTSKPTVEDLLMEDD